MRNVTVSHANISVIHMRNIVDIACTYKCDVCETTFFAEYFTYETQSVSYVTPHTLRFCVSHAIHFNFAYDVAYDTQPNRTTVHIIYRMWFTFVITRFTSRLRCFRVLDVFKTSVIDVFKIWDHVK